MRWLSLVLALIILSSVPDAETVLGRNAIADAPDIHAAASPTIIMNEVMASNNTTIKDPQGHYEDWVELHNTGAGPIDVGGLYLTDDPADPTRWQIPLGRPALTVIPAGGYLLIWLDGHTGDTGLHASFRLDATGDGIALFDSDGRTLIDGIEFDEQTPNVSYGRDPAQQDQWQYFALPTPGTQNIGAYRGRVADTKFSHDRGFYSQPFSVTITTTTPDAEIFYTVDGSSPFDLQRNMPTGRPYSGPIPIATTTCLRAMAYKLGWLPTNIDTHTYIFLDDVITQATDPQTKAQATPAGYPTSWGSATGDYQMDPDVVGQNGKDIFDGLYANTIRDDMKAAPTISLVMDKEDWFGPKGIYINQSQDGTERVASFEYIAPATDDSMQANCAIAMQGGVTGGGTSLGRWKTFKLSMRPRFKPQTDDGMPTGGPSKLDFPLFPGSPVTHFNTVVLDGVLNHSWLHPDASQQTSVMYLQDQYVADLHNVMGGYSPHGAYAHVYINGLYWGMYYIHERPDHTWAAEVFGGDESEYDAVKHSGGGVINSGTGGSASTNYNAMVSAANAVNSDPANMAKYQAISDLLDVDNFITYLLANWFTGNHDWPQKNWYATHRNTSDGKWRFHSWDAEHITEGTNSVGQSPSDIHRKLADNAEYRMKFADTIHRNFFHGGPLTHPAAADLYKARMDQIDRAIVGESARWGDNRRSAPYTRQDWLNTQNAKLANFFPGRSNQVLNALKNAGLYPAVAAPEFRIDGVAQHGGYTAAHASLSITDGSGDIWYTLDGTDPRVPGAAPKPAGAVTLVAEDALKQVLVPTGPISDAWRTDPAFVASAWQVGFGGVGFEGSKGYEDYFGIDVQSTMYQKNATCYIRIPFIAKAAALQGLTTLTLKVRYDDGFIAWLNGAELQRVAFSGTPAWNSAASSSHSDVDAVDFVSFDLSSRIADLREGANLLAIHGLNQTAASSDFLISVELVAGKGPVGSATPSGVSPTAVRYTGPVTLDKSTLVKARSLSGGAWSALNEAVFAVGPMAESLRISEMMYHPAQDPNAEFIELTNVGDEAINLNLVRFTQGIEYLFVETQDFASLPPGGYCLLVKDIPAFEARYGQKLPVLGQYAGSLNNGGERIELLDAAGGIIESFEYQDSWFDLTDGIGFSLTKRNPPAGNPDDKSGWRPSAQAGGSPGTDDAGQVPELGSVVINELLANSAGAGPDWIELYNTTDQAIDVGGWYLSDDANDLTRYRIAEGTSIPAGGYLVFYEDEHFGDPNDPGSREPFGLSKEGETLYLHSGSDGVLTGYSQQEKFDASEAGVSLGRLCRDAKSCVSTDFVALSEPTAGKANAAPVVGPIVINEILYHPMDLQEAEYVELLNISDASVTLYDGEKAAPWRLTDDRDEPGIELLFPSDPPVTLAPGAYLVLAKDASVVRARYAVPANVTVLSWGAGKLADDSERLQISKPASVDDQGRVEWMRVDRIVYSNGSRPQDFAGGVDPWPAEANGTGKSLGRINPQTYGNDAENWRATAPSPGR